jgi:hypothetical protein
MSERYGSALERALADGLEPVRAPASLWYRVDAELAGPRRARWGMSRLALAFGVLLVAVVSVGWYLERPVQPGSANPRPAQISRGEHACVLCHV